MDVNSEAPGMPPAELEAPRSGGVLARQIARYLPGMIVPAAVALASTAIFTRVLSAPEYGRFSLALGIAMLVASGSGQWLRQSTSRFLPAADTAREEAVVLASAAYGLVLLTLALAVAGGAVLALRAWVIPGAAPELVSASAAFAVATLLLQQLLALLSAQQRAGRHSVYQTAESVLRFGAALVLVGRVPRGESLLWASAAASAVLVPVLWRDVGLPSPAAALRRGRELSSRLRAWAGYGVPMAGWFICATLLEAADRYVIEWARGSAEVGIYSANYGLVVRAAGLVALPAVMAAHPLLIRAWERGAPGEAAWLLGQIVQRFIIAGLVACTLGWAFARDAAAVLGPEFRAGYRVIPLALAGLLLWHMGLYLHKPLEFHRRTRRMLALAGGAAALNLALNAALVPVYGYLAAAWVTLASYAAYAAGAAVQGRRLLAWRFDWLPVAATAAGCVAWAAGAAALREALGVAGVLAWAGGVSAAALVFHLRARRAARGG
ncbi:MAG TPA: polysaccharide biosynthesis C-terminal domain-containing protein [Longimicrobium sp.]|jgi:O-antigen/teichoic acid export membrane protein|uniref:lipopolysaccharide biosynthesis protein n=1 Tax=Longimicrobium sp. TaxID=2029185 RepID=UPI002ED818AF